MISDESSLLRRSLVDYDTQEESSVYYIVRLCRFFYGFEFALFRFAALLCLDSQRERDLPFGQRGLHLPKYISPHTAEYTKLLCTRTVHYITLCCRTTQHEFVWKCVGYVFESYVLYTINHQSKLEVLPETI